MKQSIFSRINGNLLKLLAVSLIAVMLVACSNEKAEQSVEVSTENAGNQQNQVATQTTLPTPTSAPTPTPSPTPTPEPTFKPVTLGFAGDINFHDGYRNMQYLKGCANGIKDCLSEDLLSRMNEVDYMMLNNEFAFSDRGKPAPEKDYTFRSNPKNVKLLNQMGVDIVSLANNHALDYGRDALSDTFEVLDEAEIDYVGAGENIERAADVIVYENQGKKIGYFASSRVIYQSDWVATPSRNGMQSAYDIDYMTDAIAKAKEKCDYLVVYMHWGVEYNNYPENYQREWAKMYIDAGANAVIGCHPHVVQGFEFYNGCPIVYSLGNFWFNSATKDSMYVEITVNEDNTSNLRVFPTYNENCRTYLIKSKQERARYIEDLTSFSYNVTIDKKGNVAPCK